MSSTQLSRRGVMAAAGAALAARHVQAAETVRRIQLGSSTFDVPTPYMFAEFVPPGASSTDTLPPRFSFAFTYPDGAPAGSDLEFPPVTHPFVLERPNDQFLVMCYRVSESGREKLHPPLQDQLANILLDTDRYEYFKADGSLGFHHDSTKDDLEFRYISLIDKKNQSGVQALLRRVSDAQFFYGAAEFELPGVTTILYLPEERRAFSRDVCVKASQILFDWKVPT